MKRDENHVLKIVVDDEILFEFASAVPIKNNSDVIACFNVIKSLLQKTVDDGYNENFEYNVK